MGGNDFVEVWDWIVSWFVEKDFDDNEWELIKNLTPIKPYKEEDFMEYEDRIKKRQEVIDRIKRNQEVRRKKRKLPKTPKIKIPNPQFIQEAPF